jgi:hypothetical protein
MLLGLLALSSAALAEDSAGTTAKQAFTTVGSAYETYMRREQAIGLAEAAAWKQAFERCGRTLPRRMSEVRTSEGTDQRVVAQVDFQCGA